MKRVAPSITLTIDAPGDAPELRDSKAGVSADASAAPRISNNLADGSIGGACGRN